MLNLSWPGQIRKVVSPRLTCKYIVTMLFQQLKKKNPNLLSSIWIRAGSFYWSRLSFKLLKLPILRQKPVRTHGCCPRISATLSCSEEPLLTCSGPEGRSSRKQLKLNCFSASSLPGKMAGETNLGQQHFPLVNPLWIFTTDKYLGLNKRNMLYQQMCQDTFIQ